MFHRLKVKHSSRAFGLSFIFYKKTLTLELKFNNHTYLISLL